MNTIPSGPEVNYLVSVDGEKRDITDESFLLLGNVGEGK